LTFLVLFVSRQKEQAVNYETKQKLIIGRKSAMKKRYSQLLKNVT